MVVPTDLSGPSPLDPLVLLPVPASLPPDPTADLASLLASFETALASRPDIPLPVLTAQMRLINRNAHVLLNAARQDTAVARDELDRADLALRGVEYELGKVRDETRRCEAYEAGYRDLQLPTPDEFFAEAGEETVNALPQADEEGYEHALTLARLEHELAQIRLRESEIAQLTQQRDAIIRSNKDIKMKFQTSDTYLSDFARTAGHMLTKIESVATKPASK